MGLAIADDDGAADDTTDEGTAEEDGIAEDAAEDDIAEESPAEGTAEDGAAEDAADDTEDTEDGLTWVHRATTPGADAATNRASRTDVKVRHHHEMARVHRRERSRRRTEEPAVAGAWAKNFSYTSQQDNAIVQDPMSTTDPSSP